MLMDNLSPVSGTRSSDGRWSHFDAVSMHWFLQWFLCDAQCDTDVNVTNYSPMTKAQRITSSPVMTIT